MLKMSKMQLNYLENRLQAIMQEKLAEYASGLIVPEPSHYEIAVAAAKKNPKKVLEFMFSHASDRCVHIAAFFRETPAYLKSKRAWSKKNEAAKKRRLAYAKKLSSEVVVLMDTAYSSLNQESVEDIVRQMEALKP